MPDAAPLRIVFVLRHPGALRNFQSVIRGLSENGHEVHLAFESARLKTSGHDQLLADVLEYPGVSSGTAPAPSSQRWARTGRAARLGQDYLRYLAPGYRDAGTLRARALEAVSPPLLRRLVTAPPLRRSRPRAVLEAVLAAVDRRVPADPAIVAFMREHAPDAVLVSPLVDSGSPQADTIRTARALGLPTGLLVHSWDNLTNKGLIPAPPDLVAVWNEDQRREAIELHHVSADAVATTGATPYDQWFERGPNLDRAAFCAEVGLDPARPYVLYLCSSPFIAPQEGTFVREWIVALRAQGGAAAEASILVRPHPQNTKAWSGVDLSDLPAVGIWPAGGADPVEEASRRGFYDSIHHSAAVAGINTSALIESAIVGRTVHTLLDPRSAASQTGRCTSTCCSGTTTPASSRSPRRSRSKPCNSLGRSPIRPYATTPSCWRSCGLTGSLPFACDSVPRRSDRAARREAGIPLLWSARHA